MPSLNIYLLGNFEILQNGEKVSSRLWQSRQVRAIFKLLIAMRGKPVSGEQIIELLWPEEDPEIAQQRLYVRISQLRKVLDPGQNRESIQNVAGGYRFVPPAGQEQDASCWIDADVFEYLADQGRVALELGRFQEAIQSLESARGLYRGDYLAEDLYHEWTLGERERLRDRYLVLLTELAEAYAQMGFYRRAINICRQVLVIEPCREAVFVRLMLYYYYAGERAKALQVYGQCEQALSEQLGVLPDDSTIQLADRIRKGNLWSQDGATRYPPPIYEGRLYEVPYSLGTPPFTGRDREYAWIIQEWHSRVNAIIWIEGEAGVGKTRLVEEFVGYATGEGARTFKLHGVGNQSLPYTAWIDMMRRNPEVFDAEGLSQQAKSAWTALMEETDTSFSLRLTSSQPAQANQVETALKEILCSKMPAKGLLWVEDAHLLDIQSIHLLARLSGIVAILVVCRSEDTPSGHPLRKTFENMGVRFRPIQLKRLLPGSVQDLLDKLGGGKIPSLTEKLYPLTQGNPLFLIASLQHLFEQGILFVNNRGVWEESEGIEPALSPNIEEIIALRLKQVGLEDRRILDVIGVAGGELSYELLQNVLDVDEPTLLVSVDNLIARGFLVEPRVLGLADLALPHACYQEVLYRTLPKARRRIYHRRLGEALLATSRNPIYQAGVLANHFHLGGEDEKAVNFARMAGDQALRLYAPAQALRYYQDALNWLEPLESEENTKLAAELWLGKAEGLRLSGDYGGAGVYYEKALPLLTGEFKQAAAYQAFQLKVFQGGPLSEFEDLASNYEGTLSQEGDSWALGLLYWAHSFVSLLRGEPHQTRYQYALGWRVARNLIAQGQPAPEWVLQRAFTVMMRAHNDWGNSLRSIHFAGRVLALVERTAQDQDGNAIAAVKSALGESYACLGRYGEAQEHFSECYKLAEKAGDPRLQGDASIGLGWICYERGDFSTAADYANRTLGQVDLQLDIPRLVRARLLLVCVEIIQGGDPDENMATLENFAVLARYQGSDPYLANIMTVKAEAQLAMGQLEKAETSAKEAIAISERCGLKRRQIVGLNLLAQALSHHYDRQSGLRTACKAVELASQIGCPFEQGRSLSTRAMAQPDPETARHDRISALGLFESIGAEFEAGKVRLLLAGKDG